MMYRHFFFATLQTVSSVMQSYWNQLTWPYHACVSVAGGPWCSKVHSACTQASHGGGLMQDNSLKVRGGGGERRRTMRYCADRFQILVIDL